MLSKLLVSPAVFLILLAGCSGSNFDVVGSSDAGIDDGGSAGDTTTEDSSSDAGDSGSDTSVDAPTDSCTPNACGGCAPLSNKPGETCGSCGTWTCASGKESVVCTDPGKNACGGCTTLANKPGDACGSCGTWSCGTDKESVVCNDPGKNACGGCTPLAGKPGDACGVGCGGGTYACKGTNAVECSGATAVNACGGCSPLEHAVDSSCGVCGSGKWICDATDTAKNKVVCKDPVSTPAPTTACGGKCGSAIYQCATDKLSTTCVDPVTTSAPGTSCGGRCGSATFVCATDKKSTSCVDPVPSSAPAVGGTCGVCGSSKNACNGTKTDIVCQKDDDRIISFLPNQTAGSAMTTQVFSRAKAAVVQFGVPHTKTKIGSVSLRLSRETYACNDVVFSGSSCTGIDMNCACDCTAKTCTPMPTGADTLTLQIVSGFGLTETVLDSATVSPTDVGAGSPSTVTFSFAKDLKIGPDSIGVRLITTGATWAYRLYGTDTLTSGLTMLNSQLQVPNGTLTSIPFAPYVVVNQNYCP